MTMNNMFTWLYNTLYVTYDRVCRCNLKRQHAVNDHGLHTKRVYTS